jgi:very-short-patch-repair endonuclease
MTEAERKLWTILRLRQVNGYKFRRQVPLGQYIADFVCHEARLVVEIDGGQHHHASPREAERTVFLQFCGSGTTRRWAIRAACMTRSWQS